MSDTRKPPDVLTASDALLQAAQYNYAAIRALDGGRETRAVALSQVALSLSTYALALARWDS